MGSDCALMEEVCGWVNVRTKIPVWAKLTPNVTHIEDGAARRAARGCDGVSAINTILCVMGSIWKRFGPSDRRRLHHAGRIFRTPFARSRCEW